MQRLRNKCANMFQCIIQQRNGWIHAPNPETRDVFPGNFDSTKFNGHSTHFENKNLKHKIARTHRRKRFNGLRALCAWSDFCFACFSLRCVCNFILCSSANETLQLLHTRAHRSFWAHRARKKCTDSRTICCLVRLFALRLPLLFPRIVE